MRRVGGTQAEIDDVHRLVAAPLECAQQSVNGCAETLVEDLHRVKVRVGSPLANRAGHGRAVAQAVHWIAFRGERDTPGDTSDVHVTSADSAIHDRDLYTAIDSHWPSVMV